MPTVSLIIVNFNGERLLADCLNSLNAQTYRDFETIFVDNGSTDHSVAAARNLMPEIRIIELPENTGFTGGNNAGFKVALGEYIVLLNNDTECAPDFLERLIAGFEGAQQTDPRVAMAAPKILNYFDRTLIDSVGGLLIAPDGIGMGRGRCERDSGQFDALREILMPSGCAALYSRAMLNETGLFSDDFFAYCEDSDLGLRGVWGGWRAVSVPQAVVYHKYSASTSSYSALKMRLVERNHYYLAFRNFTLSMLLALPFWTNYRYLFMAYALLRGKGKGQAAGSERVSALLSAFIAGNWQAFTGGVRQWRSRPAIKRLSTSEFRSKLKQHRVSLSEIILSD